MKLRDKVKGIFNAGRAPGTSVECGPGYHRHADKYNNRCHRIEQKHEGEGGTSNNNSKSSGGTSKSSGGSSGGSGEGGGTKVVHTKSES